MVGHGSGTKERKFVEFLEGNNVIPTNDNSYIIISSRNCTSRSYLR